MVCLILLLYWYLERKCNTHELFVVNRNLELIEKCHAEFNVYVYELSASKLKKRDAVFNAWISRSNYIRWWPRLWRNRILPVYCVSSFHLQMKGADRYSFSGSPGERLGTAPIENQFRGAK